jgi:2-polyprenyl-3-methyl-5-hydroxy-6-metoxy-1,4-benzoquinol methylase
MIFAFAKRDHEFFIHTYCTTAVLMRAFSKQQVAWLNATDRTGPGHLNCGSGSHSYWLNHGLWKEHDGQKTTKYTAAAEALAVALADIGEIEGSGSLLDVGCGYGEQIRLWLSRYHVAHVTAVEQDGDANAHISATFSAQKVTLLQGSHTVLKELSDKGSSFDSIVCLDCAIFLNTRTTFLQASVRLLRPGAMVAIADVCVAKNWFSRPLARIIVAVIGGRVGIPIANVQDAYEIAACMRSFGLTNVKIVLLGHRVFRPFFHFIWRSVRSRRQVIGLHGSRSGNLNSSVRFLASAGCLALLWSLGLVDYCLLSGQRSPDESGG